MSEYPEIGARSARPGESILNPDGTRSSEKTISVGLEDGIYLIPTVVVDDEGFLVKVSNDDAVRLYREGKNPAVGKFKTEEEALEAATIRSNSGGRFQRQGLPRLRDILRG